ncbi:MAG TPA: hypothetical protein VJA26_06940, partial [Gammaproteobacteria bacterium]|nr:hypothetical protein [Gammaproteobacteria bacterium]
MIRHKKTRYGGAEFGRSTNVVQRKSQKRHRTILPALAKIARPSVFDVYPRVRLYRLLDQARRKHPVIWISAPAGAGKTTLVASYTEAEGLPVLWYQMDAGDNDVASFFYYLGLATKEAASRYRRPMPLLTREYLPGLSTFAGNYFRELFVRLKRPGLLVFDNYQDIP